MPKKYQQYSYNNQKISFFILSILIFILVLSFSLGNALFQDLTVNQKIIEDFQKENSRILKENQNLIDQIEYFQSPQFREKWAKENKNLAKPNEKVFIFQEENNDNQLTDNNKNRAEVKEMLLDQRPVREQWLNIFFD